MRRDQRTTTPGGRSLTGCGQPPEKESARSGTAATEKDGLTAEPRTDEAGQARLSIKIGKMHCSFCVATIEKTLLRRDGVEGVSVSLAHEEGLVTYRPDVIRAPEIVATLREVGYQTPERFGVLGIPTLIWLRDGQEAARLGGLTRATDLETTLARLTTAGDPARDRG